jgi:hypothetical protein
MINLARKQMSAILKEMALTILVDPEAMPSSEAAAAALLLSHVAWQRANGDKFAETAYSTVLVEMQKVRPGFWKELRSTDATELIAQLVAYKRRHYPHDMRKVVACGTFDNKVRVEWTD